MDEVEHRFLRTPLSYDLRARKMSLNLIISPIGGVVTASSLGQVASQLFFVRSLPQTKKKQENQEFLRYLIHFAGKEFIITIINKTAWNKGVGDSALQMGALKGSVIVDEASTNR